MKSKHGDYFNHDDDAHYYDRSVTNEDDPIRAGYSALLSWMAEESNKRGASEILEFGSGTGNLTKLLSEYKSIRCVDISKKMMAIAKTKLDNIDNITFEKADLLESFKNRTSKFDVIISSYTIHHLADPEKEIFFKECQKCLTNNGVMVFGDLMFEDDASMQKIFKSFKDNNQEELIEDINDEFFWNIAHAESVLCKLDFRVEVKQFSKLSWGIIAY